MEPVTKQDLDALRDDLTGQLTAQVTALEERMTEKMRDVETTLLKEFRKWAVPMNTRARVFEVTSQAVNERLSLVEERLDALETR